jgi:hypothetical protein
MQKSKQSGLLYEQTITTIQPHPQPSHRPSTSLTPQSQIAPLSKSIGKHQGTRNNTQPHTRHIRRRRINSLHLRPFTCTTYLLPILNTTSHTRRTKDMTTRLPTINITRRNRRRLRPRNMNPRPTLRLPILRSPRSPRPRADAGVGLIIKGTGLAWVAGGIGTICCKSPGGEALGDAVGEGCVDCWLGAWSGEGEDGWEPGSQGL